MCVHVPVLYIHTVTISVTTLPPLSLTCVWVYGNALKQDTSSSVAEGGIDRMGVSSDPANIGHTGKDVTRTIVKYILTVT